MLTMWKASAMMTSVEVKRPTARQEVGSEGQLRLIAQLHLSPTSRHSPSTSPIQIKKQMAMTISSFRLRERGKDVFILVETLSRVRG